MKGVNGQPWIDLDSHVDLASLENIRYHVYAGLATSRPMVSRYFESTTEFMDPDDLKKLIDYVGKPLLPLYPKHLEVEAMDDDAACKQAYRSLEPEQQRIFLKLLGASQPFYTLALYTQGQWKPVSDNFPELRKWIETLPFDKITQVVFYQIEGLNPTVIHRDKFLADDQTHSSEFIWFRITPGKDFFVYDHDNLVKHRVTSASCFFNERDFHGASPTNSMSVSMKIWGTFTQELRNSLQLTGVY